MQAYDTLEAARWLMERGLSRDNAEAVAELMGKTIDARVASKQDILALKREIAALKSDMQKDNLIQKKDILLTLGGMIVAAVTIILTALPLLINR